MKQQVVIDAFYLELATHLADEISDALNQHRTPATVVGTGKEKQNIDRIINDITVKVLAERSVPCNIYIEGEAPILVRPAEFSIFIDPLDGSSNWLRQVGDPAVAIAIAPTAEETVTLGDLQFAYVAGLLSGDRYYASGEESIAYYKPNSSREFSPIHTQPTPSLSMAVSYLRFGYSLARVQLVGSLPLLMGCKDVRSFDNASIEIAHIARGAADFMVEARGASENYNLLAYPILKAAGGILTDLNGNSLEGTILSAEVNADYIAAATPQLLDEILTTLTEWRTTHLPAFESFLAGLDSNVVRSS